MATITRTDVSPNVVYTFPNSAGASGGNLDVSYNKQLPITVLPIPDIDSPILMNFGGVTIDLTFKWTTLTISDVQLWTSTTYVNSSEPFVTANVSAVYVVDLSAEWGGAWAKFTGIVKNFSFEQQPGRIAWDMQFDLAVGSVV